MNKLFVWLERWLPGVWAFLVMSGVTGLLLGAYIWVMEWLLSLVGVV